MHLCYRQNYESCLKIKIDTKLGLVELIRSIIGLNYNSVITTYIDVLIALVNLQAHMVDMMKERTGAAAKRTSTASTSATTSIPKTDSEIKKKLQDMENNFRILETVKGLDARIAEVEVIRFIVHSFNSVI